MASFLMHPKLSGKRSGSSGAGWEVFFTFRSNERREHLLFLQTTSPI